MRISSSVTLPSLLIYACPVLTKFRQLLRQVLRGQRQTRVMIGPQSCLDARVFGVEDVDGIERRL